MPIYNVVRSVLFDAAFVWVGLDVFEVGRVHIPALQF